jgi:hypothetical protein
MFIYAMELFAQLLYVPALFYSSDSVFDRNFTSKSWGSDVAPVVAAHHVHIEACAGGAGHV